MKGIVAVWVFLVFAIGPFVSASAKVESLSPESRLSHVRVTEVGEFDRALDFYSKAKRKLGRYLDSKEKLVLVSDKPEENLQIVDIGDRRVLISVWMSGASTHVYRVFDPLVNTSSPVCELYGWGDHKVQYKISGAELILRVQKASGRSIWENCKIKDVMS